MRILCVGDTHGDSAFWTRTVIPAAKREGVEMVLQLGDFGFWIHEYEGIKYMVRLNKELLAAGITLYWIDGNHENHVWLRQLFLNYKGQPRPVQTLGSQLWHLPRGSVVELGGKRFLACGGAFSIDKDRRIPGRSWWPEEMVSVEDVARCQSRGKADILLSHDCPEGVAPKGEHAAMKECPETAINRDRITQVMRNARVSLVLHGHWHHYHDDVTIDGIRVVGLDCNTYPRGSMAILDTEAMSVTPVVHPHRGMAVGYFSDLVT